jgi:hypothetical protein
MLPDFGKWHERAVLVDGDVGEAAHAALPEGSGLLRSDCFSHGQVVGRPEPWAAGVLRLVPLRSLGPVSCAVEPAAPPGSESKRLVAANQAMMLGPDPSKSVCERQGEL